ncbi:hypothetical protein GA0115253_101136 [Streptomyces sp. Termitarium-T10T-6]|nr:hypothetical protein [Streptomyces sp. Termitarium-T10T-6]SCD60896.1 hypothetical protein GA0115253_101136 [Streptomyces sp. Termitarium-T10T-6]
MAYVDIAGLDPAAVLAALYNASQQQGLGLLNPHGREPMTVETAAHVLAATPHRYFDYLNGRVMKVDLNGTRIDVGLYDRDNGDGAGAAVIDSLRRIAA